MAQTALPAELAPSRLRRKLATFALIVAIVVLIVVLAPGLGELREKFSRAAPGWIGVAIALEFFSCVSYVLLFKPVFCPRMGWHRAWQIGWGELAVGSLVPASGAGGLALGAWVLHRQGMRGDRIARRSVAFFLIKSSVNFVAVAVLGTLLAVGLVGPELSLWLTAVPAALSVLLITIVLLVPRLGPGRDPPPDAGRVRRTLMEVRRALIGGIAEAIVIVKSGNVLVIAGAIGYWAFDNAVLWAAFQAFGDSPALSIVLLGYLIGQLGGLLPLPGGLGGIDGGLIGTLVVYGAPLASTAAAVLMYRAILFWMPIIVGGPLLVALIREPSVTIERK